MDEVQCRHFFGHSGPKLICTHGEYNVLYFLRDIGHVGGYGGPWLWRTLAMVDLGYGEPKPLGGGGDPVKL